MSNYNYNNTIGDVIHLHEKKIHVRTYKMMKNYSVKGKHAFEFEKSDIMFINVTKEKCHYSSFI